MSYFTKEPIKRDLQTTSDASGAKLEADCGKMAGTLAELGAHVEMLQRNCRCVLVHGLENI